MVEHERVCVCVYVCIVCSMMKMMIGCAQEHFFFYIYIKNSMKIIQKYKIYLVKLVEEIVVNDIENK